MSIARCMTQQKYEQYSTRSESGEFVYVYDKNGNLSKQILIHYIYEIEPYITDEINRDKVYDSQLIFNVSRIVELCKRTIDEHSVRTLQFLLAKVSTVNDTTLVDCNTSNKSWDISLNVLLQYNKDITQPVIEFANILMKCNPDLVYRYDISNKCALYTIMRNCTMNENMIILLKSMLDTFYNYINTRKELGVADLHYQYNNNIGRVENIPIIVLSNTTRILIQRHTYTEEYNDFVNTVMVVLLKISQLMITSIKKREGMIVPIYDSNSIINLKNEYWDIQCTPLHKMLSTALTRSDAYKLQTLDVYNTVLNNGFVKKKIKKKSTVDATVNEVNENEIKKKKKKSTTVATVDATVNENITVATVDATVNEVNENEIKKKKKKKRTTVDVTVNENITDAEDAIVNEIRNNFINTVVDEHNVTCAMYASRISYSLGTINSLSDQSS